MSQKMYIKGIIIVRDKNCVIAAKGGEFIGDLCKAWSFGYHFVGDFMDGGGFRRNGSARVNESDKLSPVRRIEGRDFDHAIIGRLNPCGFRIVKNCSRGHDYFPLSLARMATACWVSSKNVVAPTPIASIA